VARLKVPGLPPEFCYQDLRHYYASLLIAARLDVKVVQARMRHAWATTTLNPYGHLWPDSMTRRGPLVRRCSRPATKPLAEFPRTRRGLNGVDQALTCTNV
jgi:hypothetical protein